MMSHWVSVVHCVVRLCADNAEVLAERQRVAAGALERWLQIGVEGEGEGKEEGLVAVPCGWMNAWLRVSDPGDMDPRAVLNEDEQLQGHAWAPLRQSEWEEVRVSACGTAFVLTWRGLAGAGDGAWVRRRAGSNVATRAAHLFTS